MQKGLNHYNLPLSFLAKTTTNTYSLSANPKSINGIEYGYGRRNIRHAVSGVV